MNFIRLKDSDNLTICLNLDYVSHAWESTNERGENPIVTISFNTGESLTFCGEEAEKLIDRLSWKRPTNNIDIAGNKFLVGGQELLGDEEAEILILRITYSRQSQKDAIAPLR